MPEKRLNVVFLFDAKYLGPALVSVASFFDVPGMEEYSVTLVYLTTDTATDQRAATILQTFHNNMQLRNARIDLRLVALNGNQFTDYVQRFHFSQAILYKAALPAVFHDYEHILFFDSGMIFGADVKEFVRIIELGIHDDELATVCAFCCRADVNGALSEELRKYPHNALYPSAAVLYFDVKRYNEAKMWGRYLSAYAAYRQILQYAEQDLLCLVLQEGELKAFSDQYVRCHIDMALPENWHKIDTYEKTYFGREYLYLKHIGSFKPWKKWILHPLKSIYLREQQRLESLIGPEGLLAIRDEELFPANLGFLMQQMMLLEAYYERQ